MAMKWSKLAPLTESDTPHKVENFKSDLLFRLNEDARFKTFTDTDTFVWKAKGVGTNRGLTDDKDDKGTITKSAVQQCRALELMLGIVASHIPVLNRRFITDQATSFTDIFNKVRMFYGYRKTGSRILNLFSELQYLPTETYEAYWERVYSYFCDLLLGPSDNIEHLGQKLAEPELFTPSLLNTAVTIWLHGIDPSLPELVKSRFSTTLSHQTVASIREDVSESISSLLGAGEDITICRARERTVRSCCLCTAMDKPKTNHFLSECPFLPNDDKRFMKNKRISKARLVESDQAEEHDDDTMAETGATSNICRVGILSAPSLGAMYGSQEITVTLDCGAESDLISLKEAKRLKLPIRSTSQRASQADNKTPLNVIGETHIFITVGHHQLALNGLVISDLSDDIIGGMPFMDNNDIYFRPKSKSIHIGDCCQHACGTKPKQFPQNRAVHIMRIPRSTTLFPGQSIEMNLPVDFISEPTVAIEPRASTDTSPSWIVPTIKSVENGSISLLNQTDHPLFLHKHHQVCNVRRVDKMNVSPTNNSASIAENLPVSVSAPPQKNVTKVVSFANSIEIGPDVPDAVRTKFAVLNNEFSDVFNPSIGVYNGASGPVQSVVNISPSLPPQRKGRSPHYSHSDQNLLQEKFDELYANKVLARPEELGITIEYLNPSFLVKKAGGPSTGHRMVTAFGELAKYAKPQPSLLPDTEGTLQKIGRWKYLIKTDLSQAYYQISLSRSSLKYCGVCSPFKGVFVYSRCAMGMPGSETALEEVMSRVLGDLIQSGSVAKIADDLYCGADTFEDTLVIWRRVLKSLSDNGMRLKAAKTTICPRSCTVLGWIWTDGTLSASPHRVSALETCDPPETVFGLRSFIGSYKFLGKVIPSYSEYLHPLDIAVAGKDSKSKITWTDTLLESYVNAQRHLSKSKSITIPRPSDSLQIVTDASVLKRGLAATLLVIRDGKPRLAGFFNGKTKDHQTRWLPCELEALSIGASVKHFSPYIIESQNTTIVLTDSKPCVQAYQKLCRGEFSSSARVMTFLSILCNYGVVLQHLSGKDNAVADFTSRNPIECDSPECQICSFLHETEDSVVGRLTVVDVLKETTIPNFTTRSTWRHLQKSCYDLKRVHAHLRQGTRPSRKERKVTDIRRYLNSVSISRDGLLVAQSHRQFSGSHELIVIPRKLVHGLTTALHLKLNHPKKLQLQRVMDRFFFALNLHEVIDRVSSNCETCTSLSDVPLKFTQQSTSAPADKMGLEYSADVARRFGQNILVLRENSSAYTECTLIPNETGHSLRDGLLKLLSRFRTSTGLPVTVRTDPAPGLRTLVNDALLLRYGITIILGREKNTNKNPIAERAIREVHAHLAKLHPEGGTVTDTDLAIAASEMNSVIRSQGLSSREIWTQRDQFVNVQLPIQDRELISARHDQRLASHQPSAKSKARGKIEPVYPKVKVGDLVYISSDRDKRRARDRYIIVDIEHPKCTVHKFHGRQLRSRPYVVDISECLIIQPSVISTEYPNVSSDDDSSVNNSDCDVVCNSDPVNTSDSDSTSEPSDDSNNEEGDANSNGVGDLDLPIAIRKPVRHRKKPDRLDL